MSGDKDIMDIRTLPLDKKTFPYTWKAIEQAIDDQVTPGLVVGIWQRDQPDQFWAAAHGKRRVDPSDQKMELSTPFDLASLTKVMGTSTLAGHLIDRGWLDINAPVSTFFDQYTDRHHSKHKVTVAHLLTHTSGLVWWKPFYENLIKAYEGKELSSVPVSDRQGLVRDLVLNLKLDSSPGEKCVYSDPSFLTLGYILEDLTGRPLDQAIEKWVWKPMGTHLHFIRTDRSLEKGRREEYAAYEKCDWRGGVLQGQVHDDNCWAMGGFGGHAGGFGTIAEVFKYVRAIHNGFLSTSTLKMFWTKNVEPISCEHTAGGWITKSKLGSSAGDQFSEHSVGHLGFAGTSIWIDIPAGIAVTLLTNRIHPSRKNEKIRKFRPVIHNAIRQDWLNRTK